MFSMAVTAAPLFTKAYAAGSWALRDVSLDLEKGDLAFVTGPSGAGKTTLMRLMFAAERPSEGQILVLGRNVGRLRPAGVARMRRRIGVVFQDFKLLARRTVEENVAVALEVTGVPARERNARVFAMLKRVGLQHRRQHPPLSLSGGEQQRVAVARAVVGDPSVILADEPTAALDSENGQAVMTVLAELAKDTSRAMFIVTHDPRIMPFADRILRIEDGRIVDDQRDGGNVRALRPLKYAS